ncbi:MAG TPA: hypothetical protein VMK30_03145 [Pleomorphomonadaceae bacterium]|nr:hypothetical protein [Pleomorphomonadaceae bacterium]
MKRRDRFLIVVLPAVAVAAMVGVFVLASQLCPGPVSGDPCPDADRNRLLVVGLGGVALALLITPGAFVIDFAAHRRIAYLGAWGRAARRGALAGLVLAAVSGLRLADALNPFSAAVVVGVAVAAEWLAIRRLDSE